MSGVRHSIIESVSGTPYGTSASFHSCRCKRKFDVNRYVDTWGGKGAAQSKLRFGAKKPADGPPAKRAKVDGSKVGGRQK